jgi:hypothetical protein
MITPFLVPATYRYVPVVVCTHFESAFFLTIYALKPSKLELLYLNAINRSLF